jgi:hypothetical protein
MPKLADAKESPFVLFMKFWPEVRCWVLAAAKAPPEEVAWTWLYRFESSYYLRFIWSSIVEILELSWFRWVKCWAGTF